MCVERKPKTFVDLKREVIDRGYCSLCRGCISFCSAGEIGALSIEDNRPTLIDEDRCLECGICYLICPNIHELDEKLKERMGWASPIGQYRRLTSAYAADATIREKGTDGGVVTALLTHLLENGSIDGALVSIRRGVWSREPVIVTDPKELLATTGYQLGGRVETGSGGAPLEQYSTYSQTLSGLRALRTIDIARIAVVGTPCQIHTIRKMQYLNVVPAHLVEFTIGLFCAQNFTFDRAAIPTLETILGTPLDEIEAINIKESFIVTRTDGTQRSVPLDALHPVTRNACFICPDFSAEWSDLSVGGLGSDAKWTTVLPRTEKGERWFDAAVRSGYIETQRPNAKERDHIFSRIVAHDRRKKRRRAANLHVEEGEEDAEIARASEREQPTRSGGDRSW